MREILFRGKKKDNEEWFYGYLVERNAKYYIYYEMPDEMCQTGNWFCNEEVIPETVGQYTGLTDKNGKKIFEGDILDTDLKRPYLVVEFRDGCFMFNCNDGGDDYYDIMLPIVKEAHTEYKYGKVIGNIHDNPELLKGGAE